MSETLQKMLGVAIAVIIVIVILYGVGTKTAKDNTISISNSVDSKIGQIANN